MSGGFSRTRKRRRRVGWAAKARYGALKALKRSRGPGVSAQARKYVKAHLGRTNPGMAGVMSGFKSLGNVLPDMVAGGVGFAGLTALGQWGGEKLVAKWGASWAPFAAPVVSLVGTVLGFLGLKMTKVGARFAGTFAISGGIATLTNALASNHVAGPAGAPALSLGRKLMLPIGDALTPGVDTGMNLGTGEYASRASLQAYVARNSLNGYMPASELHPHQLMSGAEEVWAKKTKMQRLIGAVEAADNENLRDGGNGNF